MRVSRTVESKYYWCLNMEFPPVASFIDRAVVFLPDALIPAVHTKYSEVVLIVNLDEQDKENSSDKMLK